MAITAKPTPSWRDFFPIHAAAEMFPLMSPDELRVLGEDIKKNGLTSQIARNGLAAKPESAVTRDQASAAAARLVAALVQHLHSGALHQQIAELLRDEFAEIQQQTAARDPCGRPARVTPEPNQKDPEPWLKGMTCFPRSI